MGHYDAPCSRTGLNLRQTFAGRRGMTYKLHQITGEEIPDEEARVELRKYLNPRTATWPAVDFIVGNPPFIGKGALIRESLGDGYVEALSDAWKNVPKSCDFVMYWWEKYAQLAASNKIKRFGLITTNSIGQTFNRRIIERWLKNTKPISFAFAIPDHPWIKVSDKADVRIAMTVGEAGNQIGTLHEVISEADLSTDTPRINFSANNGKIQPDLTLGTDVTSTQSTKSNSRISWNGVMLAASGFLLTPDQKARMIFSTSRLLRPFLHGKYLTKRSKEKFVIDTFEKSIEDLEPPVCQYLLDHVNSPLTNGPFSGPRFH